MDSEMENEMDDMGDLWGKDIGVWGLRIGCPAWGSRAWD